MRINVAVLFACAGFVSSALTSTAIAQTQAQADDAKWIMERITGVKWAADSAIMKQAMTMAAAGNRNGIAALATSQAQFLNVTVKNFGAVMSTREETIRIPLNDFSATIIGITRDESDAREMLYGNFFYGFDAAIIADPKKLAEDVLRSNNHYQAMDNRKTDFGAALVRINGQRLVQKNEDGNAGTPYVIAANPDPAGVLTSRSWIGAHAIAGTNRRPLEYTFREFMCLPLASVADAAASDIRIGRDITRFPGDDHVKFQTTCKACHTVMDGFRGAWAHWDFDDNTMVNSQIRGGNFGQGGVANKMNQNNQVYPGGYVVVDDSWVNNAIRGTNVANLGWRGLDGRSIASTGTGLNSYGHLFANSQRFSTCMAKRVFTSVCRKELDDSELSVYQAMGTQFEANTYNLKKLFQAAALNPRCK